MVFQLPVTALIHAIGLRNVSPPADSIKPFALSDASNFRPYIEVVNGTYEWAADFVHWYLQKYLPN